MALAHPMGPVALATAAIHSPRRWLSMACPRCGCPDSHEVLRLDSRGDGYLAIRQCEGCKHVWAA